MTNVTLTTAQGPVTPGSTAPAPATSQIGLNRAVSQSPSGDTKI